MVVCLGRIFVQNTYAKFTSGYETGNDIANLNLSFDVKISNLEEYEEISVGANDFEVFNVNVKNSSSTTTYYGIWYMMASPKEKSSDIVIARLEDNTTSMSGSINSGKDVTASVVIKNNSSSNIKVNIGVASNLKSTSDIEYLGGKKLITGTTSVYKLSSVEVGSYVKYIGNNGCSGKACEGQNANYVDSSNMGYCYSSSYKFNSSGWRVAYISDETAYLTSGGAPECMCTDSSGNSGTSCSSYESTDGVPKHLANLNAKALTYCNSTYVYGGTCNSSSAWNMNDFDFQKITGDTLSTAYTKSSGYYTSYSIINNGSYYWFATSCNASSTYAFHLYPTYLGVGNDYSSQANGIRPVLRLQSSVVVTGGSGTMDDPYVISNG